MFSVSRRSSNGQDECSIGETSTPAKSYNWFIPTSKLILGKSKAVNPGTLKDASLPELVLARDSYPENETLDQKMSRLRIQVARYAKEEKEMSAKLCAFFGQISHFNGHSSSLSKNVDSLVADNKSLFVAALKKALVEEEITQLTVTRSPGAQVVVAKEGPGRLVIRSLSFPLRYPGKLPLRSTGSPLPRFLFFLVVRNCALVCVLRHKSQVVTSPVVRQSTGDTLTFAINYTFEGLQADFQVIVELHLMPLDPSFWATNRADEGLWARIFRNFGCCSRPIGDEPKELMMVKLEIDSPLVRSAFRCLGTVTIERTNAAEMRRRLVNLEVSTAPCTGTVLLDHELTVDYELGLAGDNVFLGHFETRPSANASAPFRLKLFKCALFLNKSFLAIRRKKTFGGTVESNLDLARCINDDSSQASLSTSGSKYTHLCLIFTDHGESFQ